MIKTEEEWKNKLTPEEYKILREKGTEAPFSGEYYKNHETGKYLCGACGQELFSSDTKYDSGSGWPSFVAPEGEDKVEHHFDESHGMRRTEVVCSRCGSHLGHVFDDGPDKLENGREGTGKRYCINSRSLKFEKK